MTVDEIIIQLKYIIGKEQGRVYNTFSTNVEFMAKDCLRVIERQQSEIERLSANEIVRCFECTYFDNGYCQRNTICKDFDLNSVSTGHYCSYGKKKEE